MHVQMVPTSGRTRCSHRSARYDYDPGRSYRDAHSYARCDLRGRRHNHGSVHKSRHGHKSARYVSPREILTRCLKSIEDGHYKKKSHRRPSAWPSKAAAHSSDYYPRAPHYTNYAPPLPAPDYRSPVAAYNFMAPYSTGGQEPCQDYDSGDEFADRVCDHFLSQRPRAFQPYSPYSEILEDPNAAWNVEMPTAKTDRSWRQSYVDQWVKGPSNSVHVDRGKASSAPYSW